MNLEQWMIPVAGLVAGTAITLAIMTTWHTMSPEEREDAYYKAQGAVPPNHELLSRVVSSCTQLQQEINEMTQVTAEIRKVMGDVVHLSCPKSSTEWIPPNPPPCPDDKFAALISEPGHYGFPSWACVSKETGKAPEQP